MPANLESLQFYLDNLLKRQLQEFSSAAESIQRMSDFYTQESRSPTPWNESWATVANRIYYYRLNSLRAQRVFEKGQQLGFWNDVKTITDFGSGLGAGSLPFFFSDLSIQKIDFIERSTIAQKLHQSLIGDLHLQTKIEMNWSVQLPKGRRDLFLASYSLNELEYDTRIFESYNQLALIEPSTQISGRRLMKLREELIQKGFFVWAPCTHQSDCPLLEKSEKDWCHDRVHHLRSPEWEKLEKTLNMKNNTLTFSYLLASRSPPPTHLKGKTRVVGDALIQKGKTRQLICRQNEKEYLSFLDREGPAPQFSRGDLLLVEGGVKKGEELRSAVVSSV